MKNRPLFTGLMLTLALVVLVAGPAGRAAAGGPAAEPAAAYASSDYLFDSGQVRLGGTLYRPAGPGPFPAVVILHGSEAVTRDHYWQTGDATVFLEAGFAVFLFDQRGTGQSGGRAQVSSLEELAGDALAAVSLVRRQPGIRPEMVGLFGVSQGGSLSTLAASQSDEVAFAISVTATATPLANQEMWGVGNILRERGFSEAAIETEVKAQHLLYSARSLIRQGLLPLGDLWFVAKDPYLDPAGYWPSLQQPTFMAYGAVDGTVPTATSVAIGAPILAAGHPSNRLYVYDAAGHGVRTESGGWQAGHIATMTAWAKSVAAGEEPAGSRPVSRAVDSGDHRWYGLGRAQTPWYGTAAVQLPLILLFGLAFLAVVVLSLLPAVSLRLAGYGLLPRLVLGLSGLVNLALLAGLLVVVNFLLNADAEGYVPPVPLSGLVAALSLAGLALFAGLLFLAVKGFHAEQWSPLVKTAYLAAAAVTAGHLLFLNYWGLLGGRL